MERGLLWASNWYENILETGLWIRGERQFGMLTTKEKKTDFSNEPKDQDQKKHDRIYLHDCFF